MCPTTSHSNPDLIRFFSLTSLKRKIVFVPFEMLKISIYFITLHETDIYITKCNLELLLPASSLNWRDVNWLFFHLSLWLILFNYGKFYSLETESSLAQRRVSLSSFRQCFLLPSLFLKHLFADADVTQPFCKTPSWKAIQNVLESSLYDCKVFVKGGSHNF